MADGSRSSINTPVQAVTGEFITMLSQAEIEVDPLLQAQDTVSLGGSGGGAPVIGSSLIRGGS